MSNTPMHFTLLVMFFITAFMSHVGFAAEDGMDIFLKAIDSQQNNSVLFSGKGSYDLTKSIANKTEKEIQEECDQMIADFKKTFPNHPMAETIISNIPDAVKTKYSQKQTFSGTFRFDYSKKDYQYIENQLIFDGNSKMPVTVIEKRALPQKTANTEAAMLDPSISQVIVNNSASTVADFRQFGRLRGALTSLMIGMIDEKGALITKDAAQKQIKNIYGNNKDLTILEIVKTTPYDNDSTSYTIESTVSGKVTQRYIIVPKLGYICPKIEFFDLESGNLIEEYEAKNFVLSPRSGLYYPTYYIESSYNSSGKLIERREYKINQETLSLNETMSPKDFSLNIPEGLKVMDMRDGKKADYVAEESGVLSLESGGLDLKHMSWLKIPGDMSKISSGKSHLFVRILLMMIGLSLIIWALIKRRHDKKSLEEV